MVISLCQKIIFPVIICVKRLLVIYCHYSVHSSWKLQWLVCVLYATWSHKNTYLCALFCATPFYLTYCTFRRLKEKCPLSGAKTQVKYVNPDTFLLCRYRYILLCFYYIATGTYNGASEFKYLGSVPKS